MNVHMRRAAWMSLGIVLLMVVSAWGQESTEPVATEPAEETVDADSPVGIVTGDNVYVRSGSDQNYYPVTRLNRGDEVMIVGERRGWLEILTPAGTFSVIDKNYVDREGEAVGVLNGTAWVHAGSSIDKRRYAKQVKLGKGDRVTIIGETEDGTCYTIEPPAGATLWMSGDYVRRSGEATAITPVPTGIEPIRPGELTTTRPGPVPGPGIDRTKIVSGKTDYRLVYSTIEAEIAAEAAKPTIDRTFEPMIKKLRALANQNDDAILKAYAEARIVQLEKQTELVALLHEMRELKRGAIEDADALHRDRMKIRPAEATPPDGIVVRGEIRVSSIYSGSATTLKRWRIVEPGVSPPRTLAYIEVPKGSPIDPVQYYGKYVGIRASRYRVPSGTIPPVIVYTVQDIVVLDPAKGEPEDMGNVTTRPAPTVRNAPTSQPAGE